MAANFLSNTGDAAFRPLALVRQGQGRARECNAAHIQALRDALQPLALSAGEVQKLNALAHSADGELFWEELLQLGRQYGRGREAGKAGIVFSFLLRESAPQAVKERAQLERAQLLGQSSVGRGAEAFLSSFAGASNPLQGIFPLIAGSALGQVVSAAAFHRLVTAGSAAFWTRGLSAKFLSGLLGAAVEMPFFALAGGTPSGAAQPDASVWGQAALTAGSFRLFGWAGRNRVAPPISGAAALAAVQSLEMALHPENRTSIAFRAFSIFDMVIRWNAGSTVAHGILGAKFAAFQKELMRRAENHTGSAPNLVFAKEMHSDLALQGVGTRKSVAPISGNTHLAAKGQLLRMANSDGGEPTTSLSLDEFVALSHVGEAPVDSKAGLLALLQDPELASDPATQNLVATILSPSSSDLEMAAIPSLSSYALDGNLEALRILGERGREDPAAVRELLDLDALAGEYQSGSETIGGLDPSAFRLHVQQALGSAACEDASALRYLMTDLSGGSGTFESIFAVAEGDFTQTPEAQHFLDSLPSRMAKEFPALQAVLALANRGYPGAREALAEWRDFRHYEDRLSGSAGSAEVVSVLSEIAKLNSRLNRVLRRSSAPAETTTASSSTTSVSASAPAADSSPSIKKSVVSSRPRVKAPEHSDSFVKIHRVIHRGLMRMTTLEINQGEPYSKIEILGQELPLWEKRALMMEWLGKLAFAVQKRQAKQQILFFDAIHALSHTLSAEFDSEDMNLRAEMLLGIQSVRKQLPMESHVQLGLLCLNTCGEMGHLQIVVPSEREIDFQMILGERQESQGIGELKRILNEIHRIPEGAEKEEPYGRLDAAIDSLNIVELRRLADEATEELRGAARESLNQAHWEGQLKPNFLYRSKIAVLSNLLRRVFGKMGPGEAPRFVARLQRDERLMSFDIAWLSSYP